MKIEDQLYPNIHKELKSNSPKGPDKLKPSIPSQTLNSLVQEVNQDACTVSIATLENAHRLVQIDKTEEADQVAQKLQTMILRNSQEVGRTHSNLKIARLKDLLPDG
jgi:hypothetical protein